MALPMPKKSPRKARKKTKAKKKPVARKKAKAKKKPAARKKAKAKKKPAARKKTPMRPKPVAKEKGPTKTELKQASSVLADTLNRMERTAAQEEHERRRMIGLLEALREQLRSKRRKLTPLDIDPEEFGLDVLQVLSLLSLGVDIETISFRRSIPISVYASASGRDDAEHAEAEVDYCVSRLLETIGLERFRGEELIVRSILRFSYARFAEPVTGAEVRSMLGDLVGAVKGEQVEIEARKTSCVAGMLRSIQGVDHATVQIGPLLILKDGKGSQIAAMALAPAQLAFLAGHQEMAASPAALRKELETVSG